LKIVEVENLSIFSKNRNKYLLSNFSFSLNSGQIHAIVGASGSGKTTFAVSLLNLLSPDLAQNYSKYILFNKEYDSFSNLEWNSMRGENIFIVPQNPIQAFHPFLSLKNQVLDFLELKQKNISLDELVDSLNNLGIDNPYAKLKKRPFEISGGERQRILIAMSSFVSADIIIADEPTSALDSINEKKVLEMLYFQVKTKNSSLILIAHDRRIVRELADITTIIKNGEWIETLSLTNGKFSEFKNKYTQELLDK
jgi:peptide/nickel transport system ATP-binding protein